MRINNMGKLSAYQLQAAARTKRALKQVSVADAKLRAAVRNLADALGLAKQSRETVEALNTLYGTKYPELTKFVGAVVGLNLAELMKEAGADSVVESLPLTQPVADSKDGALLPGRAVFGEYEAPVAPKHRAALVVPEPQPSEEPTAGND